MDPDSGKKLVATILAARHPRAKAGLLCGSIATRTPRIHSDIDLIIFYDWIGNSYLESFLLDGRRVESIIFDAETSYHRMIAERKHGYCTHAEMVRHGIELPGPCVLSSDQKKLAQQIIELGPPPFDSGTHRYAISMVLADFEDCIDTAEGLAIITDLYKGLAIFYLRANGLWCHAGKHLAKALSKENPQFCLELNASFVSYCSLGHKEPILSISRALLQPYGGLFTGCYRSESSALFRFPLPK